MIPVDSERAICAFERADKNNKDRLTLSDEGARESGTT